MRERSRPSIDVVADRSGATVYRLHLSPEALPPVRSGDLADGWDIARRAAIESCWGTARLFRFCPEGDGPVDLALTDADAACWAEAVDRRWGLQTPYGLSLCLRLLSLVALLAGSPALRRLCPLSRAGAEPDPALLRAASAVPLSARGQLDEHRLFAHLAQAAPAALPSPTIHSGATS